jgi:hypothetical protein
LVDLRLTVFSFETVAGGPVTKKPGIWDVNAISIATFSLAEFSIVAPSSLPSGQVQRQNAGSLAGRVGGSV